MLRPSAQLSEPSYDDDEEAYGGVPDDEGVDYYDDGEDEEEPFDGPRHNHEGHHGGMIDMVDSREFARQVEEEGAFVDDTNIPIDEAIAAHAASAHARPPPHQSLPQQRHAMDPPEDEPPSLSIQRYSHQEEQNRAAQPHHPQPHLLQQPPASYYPPEYDDDDDNGEYYDEEFYCESNNEDSGGYFARSPEVSESVTSPSSAAASEHDEEVVQHMVMDSSESPDRPSSMQQRRNRASELPPVSPRSPNSDTFSQTSAMREAQEIVQMRRGHRQRRLLSSPGSSSGASPPAKTSEQSDERAAVNAAALTKPAVKSPTTDSESAVSGTTWESGSDFTGSSVWTDNDSNAQGSHDQRGSRRALILQMAKARMKSNARAATPTSQAAATTPSGVGNSKLKQEEEKKVDGVAGSTPEREDLDLTGDLD